jgi:hypothetical protein
LIQVAPVEVVALCDPDKNMLQSAVKIASERQKSRNKPQTYSDYRKMLGEHELEFCSSVLPITGTRSTR